MKIIIHTNGLTLKESDEQYIQEKMKKVSTLAKRLQDESSEIGVEVDHDKTRAAEDEITVKIHVKVPRDHLEASAHGSLVTEAVDKAKKKLLPQIEKYKDKFGTNS